jgi:hypothetical protein
MGTVVGLLEYRYARLYRAQVAAWLSHGLRLSICHQIATHACRGEFVGRIKPAQMAAINARLRLEPPPVIPSPLNMEEAS